MWSKKDETSIEKAIQLIKKLKIKYSKEKYDITFCGDMEGYLLVNIYKKNTEELVSQGWVEDYID